MSTSRLAGERLFSPCRLEARFRFLGVGVHVLSDSVRQMQYWASVYRAFAAHPVAVPDITVRTHGDSSAGTLVASVEYTGHSHPWDGKRELLPPWQAPHFDGWVHLQGSMVSRAGHGVMLLGKPGAGKTALTLAGVRAGALLVADGTVPLAVDDLLAHPFPRALRLRRHDLDALDIPLGHPALSPFRTRDGDVQWRADPHALFPDRTSRTATEVAAVVLAGPPSGDEPRLVPASPDEALAGLLGHLHVVPSEAPAALDALIRLSARTPAFVLSAGTPRSSVALLDRLLV
jgi:hypothetical protein